MSDNDTTRRRFVAAAGAVTTAALAGCAGGDDETDDSDSMDDGMTTADGMDGGMETTADGMGMETTEGGMETEGGMDGGMAMEPTDPADAPRASIDRFSEAAGTLHVRAANGDLPGPDEPIDFDANFLTQGFGPDGEVVQYYDFDVQPTDPAPIYAFFDESGDPIEGQLNVVDVVPGDEGYNDFCHVHRVTVPEGYEANSVTSAGQLMDAGFDIEATDTIKNCPIVPEGSTASMRYGGGTGGLVEGWYDGQVVSYFLFEEASLSPAGGSVPLSPIYVTFETNPGRDGGGPPSGFMTEEMSAQTHNVLATTPDDGSYSPLWSVNVYDNADFDAVSDLESATDAELLAGGTATVNCPVVSVE